MTIVDTNNILKGKKRMRTIKVWQGVVTKGRKPLFKGFIHSRSVTIESDDFGNFDKDVVYLADKELDDSLQRKRDWAVKHLNLKPFGEVGKNSYSSGQKRMSSVVAHPLDKGEDINGTG